MKLDENVPVEAAELVRAAGWNCGTVHDERLASAEDAQIAAVCQAEARVLFTLDLDFADIRAYPPKEYVGIVVFRPAEPSRRQVLDLVTRFFRSWPRSGPSISSGLWSRRVFASGAQTNQLSNSACTRRRADAKTNAPLVMRRR